MYHLSIYASKKQICNEESALQCARMMIFEPQFVASSHAEILSSVSRVQKGVTGIRNRLNPVKQAKHRIKYALDLKDHDLHRSGVVFNAGHMSRGLTLIRNHLTDLDLLNLPNRNPKRLRTRFGGSNVRLRVVIQNRPSDTSFVIPLDQLETKLDFGEGTPNVWDRSRPGNSHTCMMGR